MATYSDWWGMGLVVVALTVGACGATSDGPAPLRGSLDEVLRLNHMQVLGTHNSYHGRPDPVLHPSHDYDHVSLTAQLDLGVRAFEIDIHNPDGAVGPDDFAVYHILVADMVSSCAGLRACLSEVDAWSQANPWHVPITVWIEPKGDAGGGPIRDLARLDEVISTTMRPERLLTPRAVRGDHATLRAALSEDGWPMLGDVRGKVLFCLLDDGTPRDRYVGDYAEVDQRLVFVRAGADELDEPWAAVTKFNDPGDERIAEAHARNLLVASNLCTAGDEDATACARGTADAAHGSHWLKTDFPDPADPAAPYTFAILPHCNPVTAPTNCVDGALE